MCANVSLGSLTSQAYEQFVSGSKDIQVVRTLAPTLAKMKVEHLAWRCCDNVRPTTDGFIFLRPGRER